MSSSDIVPHRMVPTMLKQPSTIRGKPSRPLLLLPQASSFDTALHHSGHCTNASRRGPLQADETTPERRPLATNEKAAATQVRKATPFLPAAR